MKGSVTINADSAYSMDFNYMFPKRMDLHDLYPIYIGCEKCEAGHDFGPAIRDFTIIHYVNSGKGKFTSKGKQYDVGPGEAFVINPGEVTYYVADTDDPWEYYWFSFSGSLADKFLGLESPIIKPSADVFLEPVKRAIEGALSVEFAVSKLYVLYGELFSDEANPEQGVIKKISRYIRHNYMEDISVETLARTVNLDRRYLTRIFKEETGLSIMPYILSVRCAKAKSFLEMGYNVRQTAAMVGYSDAYTFSKMFKKHTGISPSDSRYKNWDWNLSSSHPDYSSSMTSIGDHVRYRKKLEKK